MNETTHYEVLDLDTYAIVATFVLREDAHEYVTFKVEHNYIAKAVWA